MNNNYFLRVEINSKIKNFNSEIQIKPILKVKSIIYQTLDSILFLISRINFDHFKNEAEHSFKKKKNEAEHTLNLNNKLHQLPPFTKHIHRTMN